MRFQYLKLCNMVLPFSLLPKGQTFYILFAISAAGVVSRDGRKKSPRTPYIVQIILFLSILWDQ